MNKKLMAVAVASAFAVPGFALAQVSSGSGGSVTISGYVDALLNQVKSTGSTGAGQASTWAATTTQATMNKVGPANTTKYHLASGAPAYLRIVGNEPLGGGMRAFFQIETQWWYDAPQDQGQNNTRNATLGGRPTFVGVGADWGAVTFGYQVSAYLDAVSQGWSVQPTFGHGQIIMNNGNTTGSMPSPNCSSMTASGTNQMTTASATVNNFIATSTTRAGGICTENPGNSTSFGRTQSNTILYRSPAVSGFRFAAMMATPDGAEPSSSTPVGMSRYNPAFGAYSLSWSGGPFSVAGGYEQHTGFRALNPTQTQVSNAMAGTATLSGDRAAKDKAWSIGGKWDFGIGRVGVGYEKIKYGNSAISTGAAADNSFELANWVVNAAFRVGPQGTVGVGYSKTTGAKNCGVSLATAATTTTAAGNTLQACGSDTGANYTSLSYDHALSKRTTVYAVYAKINNNPAATYQWVAGAANGQGTSNNGSTAGVFAGTDVQLLGVGLKHSF